MWFVIFVFAGLCALAITTADSAKKEKDRREELQFYVDISKAGRGKR